MAACVTIPTRTVFSTPVNIQTITETITTTYTNPGAEVTQTLYSTSCLPYIPPPSAKFIRQIECPNGTTVYTSYTIITDPPSYITSTEFITTHLTNFGAPVAVETQFDTSCSNTPTTTTTTSGSSSITTRQTSSTSASSTSLFFASPTPQPLPASSSITSTSSSSSPAQTQDNVVVGHRSHKTAAISGGVVAGLLCLAIVAGTVFYFKFWKAGGPGKSGHHGHHGGEKTDIDGTTGGGGGGTGVEHLPGHATHNVPPPNFGGTGIETSSVGAGGPAGTASGGGMDTSAEVGGGYGGTAPPASGLEGQFHASTLPPGTGSLAHHAYPVIVPVGARRRESGQAQQEMVNTLPTPWTDPAQQQQQQSSYYYPHQQGQQQFWQNAAPYASAASSAQYPNSGPGWADPAYSSYSQPGYNGTQYPADPRMSQGGYPVDPHASGRAYYPGFTPGHTSPNQNRTSVISSSPSSAGNPRASLLPYTNEYGAPQPGPSIAGTPAPPTPITESSTDPFDIHAEAAASAGPSDRDQPPPSYDEAGPSAQPFVPQDAKGRQ